MPKLDAVVRSICLHLPEAEEVSSHGSPEFRVRGKGFAAYTVNHHGDGRLALLLNASLDTQGAYVSLDSDVFFVPQYVGPRGWYGIDLAKGLPWPRVAELVTDAYRRVAPKTLAKQAEPLKKIKPPDTVDLKRIDPFFFPKNQKLLARLRKLCMALPEVTEALSFGYPVFKAGKKTFCQFYCAGGRPCALFWVGNAKQSLLSAHPLFDVPPYMGHNGWIRHYLDEGFDDGVVRDLMLDSYRHFALKRMLAALDA